MKISAVAAFGCLLGFVGPVLAADTSRAQNPSDIVRAFRDNIGDELLAAQRDAARLEAHIEALENVKSDYEEKKDAPAIARIQESEVADHASLDRAQKLAARLQLIQQSAVIAVPIDISGHVSYCSGGGDCVPLISQTAILEGDLVKTGPDGDLTIVSEDGARMELAANTSLSYASQASVELVWELRSGDLAVERDPTAIGDTVGRFRCDAPGLTVESTDVQGLTAFSLHVDGETRTHVIPQSGTLVVKATQTEPELIWWNRDIDSAEHRSMMTGHWGRVRLESGDVTANSPDGAYRRMGVSDELSADENIRTGKRSAAWCELMTGYQSAMNSSSEIRFRKPKRARPEFVFSAGDYHVQWSPGDKPDLPIDTLFETLRVKARAESAEFDVHLSADGRSEWIPYKGTLELTVHEL